MSALKVSNAATISPVAGGWVIDKKLIRTPGVYESRATASLARMLTDAEKRILQTAASNTGRGNGNIRYEDVWGAVNATSDRKILEAIRRKQRLSELDLSGDSDIPEASAGPAT